MLERDYQRKLIKKIKRLLPDCMVLKNDSSYLQGIPDLTILFEDRWAVLEVKPEEPLSPRDYEPNQRWYLDVMNEMSFAACIYPENEREVLNALQHALRPRRPARISQRV